MDVTIEGLGAAGDGVGRLEDGRVVFVEGAFPGDRVRVRLSATRKRVQYADMLELLERSPERVESVCEDARCGGCPLKDLAVAAQVRLKRQRILETMRRVGGQDVGRILDAKVLGFGDGWAYRHRVRLHAAQIAGDWCIGYFERRSRRLVPFASCPVLWPELEQSVSRLSEALRGEPRELGLVSLDVVRSRRDGRTAVRLRCRGDAGQLRAPEDFAERCGVSGVEVTSGSKRWRRGNLELRYDHGAADKLDLIFEPGVFTQAYPEANDALVRTVQNAVRPREGPVVLELHAGIGNFTVPLARAGARLQAVERDRRAAALCRRNGDSPGLDIEVRARDDEDAVRTARDVDVVLLDPPRTGARGAVEALARTRFGRVVYVACDVATLARDAAILCAGGFRLTSMQSLDMFPQTPHVEVVSTFER